MSIKLYAKKHLGFTSVSQILKKYSGVKKYNPIYVKKIWSLNPTKYKFILLFEALKKYDEYLANFKKPEHSSDWKSFEDWLTTEI